jgi:PhzF family phenazine biosynthesis protein
MNIEAYIVNSFTTNLAEGNPAGVVILEREIPDLLMQNIAKDFNKSETVFVFKNNGQYDIRWFSPVKEVSLCGHASLAAAKVLFANEKSSIIEFKYKNGSLRIEKEKDDSISIEFPEDQYEVTSLQKEYLDFFGIDNPKDCIYGIKTRKIVLVVDESMDLANIHPKFEQMAEYKGLCSNGIGITKLASHDKNYDIESRYFNPWYGVNEDPVTGTVHTLLSSYWGNKLNKDKMIAYQNSQRPGIIKITRNNGNVILNGHAKIFMKGNITL